ncbi:MAG: subclass B3 metallo-beta-lactamase [Bacteroidetes bacterium]|nr:subclass B3 metallo-beta-lactamase [Bacteroidota bacterium]
MLRILRFFFSFSCTPVTKTIILFLCICFSVLVCEAQDTIKAPFNQEVWTREYAPFRIAGDLYYVGSYDLGCYLITTPEGHILINTGTVGSMPMIRAHVEQLGFRFEDIRILLATHAHFDHVGAMAAVKAATGAQAMIEAHDAPLVADGGESDFIFGGRGKLFPPFKADRLLHDHDTVRLGNMEILVLHHPGHTPGACSYLTTVHDDHRSYRVLIANMPSVLDETDLAGMPAYPNVGQDYAYTLDTMRHLQFDIWLASHASQFGLQQKHKGRRYHPAAFIDPKGYAKALAALDERYRKKLK